MTAIAVYCASATRIDPAFLDLAAEVGTAIGKRRHVLVTGGGSVAMMGAVGVAARAAGAHTVGVIPRHLVLMEVADHDSDELVLVDTMRERKAEMDRRADAFLVLPGGIGTLEEFFEVWTAASLGMHAKPVVVLDPSGFYAPLWSWLDDLSERGFVRRTALDTLVLARTVEEALTAAETGRLPG
ncbi:MAG TPA: TIGR00730 family Rossman fold protein [Mycobacteriales bacterium]|nr:TIGR00730 family Rossman fold protein [Mycobacteriales bacterium]